MSAMTYGTHEAIASMTPNRSVGKRSGTCAAASDVKQGNVRREDAAEAADVARLGAREVLAPGADADGQVEAHGLLVERIEGRVVDPLTTALDGPLEDAHGAVLPG